MSGGIAWVLDEEDTLDEKMNTGHVKAYPVSPEQADELQRLLMMHVKATGSPKAQAVLDDFAGNLPKFKAVISDEYRSWLKGA